MNEIWTSIISGAFAGASVVTLLTKYFIENRLKRSVQKYQHELDARKNSLQTELGVYAHQQNLRFSKYEEAKRDAVKNIYVALISTSFPRNGFRKFHTIGRTVSESEFCSQYFDAFSESFKTIGSVFKKISNAYAVLEENSIYIEQKLENEVVSTLDSIMKHYTDMHDLLEKYHADSQKLSQQAKLTSQSAVFDFGEFYDDSSKNWINTTTNLRRNLKNYIRDVFSPA